MQTPTLAFRDVWDECVRTHPEQTFLVFSHVDKGISETYTYADFDRRIKQVANLFLQSGVEKGSQVAVQLPNSVELVEVLLACLLIGAVFVPLNVSYTQSECQYIFDTCDIKLLLRMPDSLCVAPAGVPTLIVGDPQLEEGYEQLSGAQLPTVTYDWDISADDLAEIMFTSGTTARPKGVMLTQANLVFSGMYVNWQLAMNDQDRFYTTMVASHVNFQLSALLPVITSSSCLILANRFSASRFWSEVRKYRATQVQSMAMIVRTTMRQPVDPEEKNHWVRFVHYFLPLTEEEKNAYEERFQVRLINNYGSTESLVGVITDIPYGPRNWPAIGRPGIGYQAKIIDANGAEVAAGQKGEILVRGRAREMLMAGYYREPEATAKALDSEGWYHTGDFGYVDQKGWFYFSGRGNDLIKRAGENISALEIEQVLSKCPGVGAVAVVGVPDSCRDEAIKAVVVRSHSSLSEADLLEYAQQHLAYFKIPKYVEFRESLPRGEYGKVQKNKL